MSPRNVLVWLSLLLGSSAACQPQTAVTSPSRASSAAPSASPEGASAAVRQPASPEELKSAAATITADALRAHIARLASDELAGRAPATGGDVAARAYLIEQLKTLGVQPAVPERFEQPVQLVSMTAAFPATWAFQGPRGAVKLEWWEEYVAGSGVQAKDAALDRAELVFAGYGIQAPEYDWDDFKGQDVSGKVLLFLNDDPDWDPALFAGKTRLYYGRWTYKFEAAARQGAAGALIIHTRASAGYPFQVVQSSWGGEVFELPSEGESPLRVKGWVTEPAARKLVALSGKKLEALVEAAKSREFKPIPLGLKTSLRFQTELRRVSSANVLGVLRGSDPTLADEYVVLSAHFDHLGVGKPNALGDSIYNGARDNAAGVATVLAIAKAVRALPTPPRRSLLILFPTAEEQGLLGSKYFVEHPSVEVTKMVANVNFDGGNIWGRTSDVSQVGHGKSTVDEVVKRAAAAQNRVVKPDQFPDRGGFYRSDQFNFARVGVPAVYLKSGTAFLGRSEGWGNEQALEYESRHYHQPSDELTPDWNFDGLVEDTQLGFLVTVALANSDVAPTWHPGDEFEAVRRASLERARSSAKSGNP